VTSDQEKTARRGNPSFVWRAGQERRLALVRLYAPLEGRRILDVGCGMGMYTHAFLRFSPEVYGIELEADRAREAHGRARGVMQAVGEALPFKAESFDVVFSHEVLEHVSDDRWAARELTRVTRPGGRIVIFVPNRLYPYETHGIYWRDKYRFGNIPLVNWLPDPLRNHLAPHVRAYTARGLRQLFADEPVRELLLTQIFPGYDNVVARKPKLGRLLQRLTYTLERTPLRAWGLSHLLVLEKTGT